MSGPSLHLRAPLLTLQQVAYFRQTSIKGAYNDYLRGALPRTLLADGSEFRMFKIVLPALKVRRLLDPVARAVFDAWQRGGFEMPRLDRDYATPPPFPSGPIAQIEQSVEQ